MIARLGHWLSAMLNRCRPTVPPTPTDVKIESRDREIRELERRAGLAMKKFDTEVQMIRRGKRA